LGREKEYPNEWGVTEEGGRDLQIVENRKMRLREERGLKRLECN
jgi:hypothetical protein